MVYLADGGVACSIHKSVYICASIMTAVADQPARVSSQLAPAPAAVGAQARPNAAFRATGPYTVYPPFTDVLCVKAHRYGR